MPKADRLTTPACVMWLAALNCLTASAADTNQFSKLDSDLENLALEQLVNVQVTSVSKRETVLFTSPAAISGITQEDIRRSGMTSIPESLRLVPGPDVARIDGRTVYSPVTAADYWNVQDTPLEDIDRIGVIRGPGATLWGANAVNGVINIITKSAKDNGVGIPPENLMRVFNHGFTTNKDGRGFGLHSGALGGDGFGRFLERSKRRARSECHFHPGAALPENGERTWLT